MAQIEINGKPVLAETGQTIIEAADTLGIWIPRFCYHKKLSIAANCRMCLVEVEKSAKPLPACATPISDGMKIWTESAKAIAAQKSVMEFLLINHPLDCPICDQGGECELQDLSLGYGSDVSRFTLGKRVIQDHDIGSLVQTDMTRCIQCTRCVRFGTEVAGVRELGAYNRGEAMEIGTFVQRSVDSEVSGNIIDLCPVGALTSKPFRYEARGWELKQTSGIAPHDCLGSNIYIHSRREKVLRVVPRENENLNEVWISDRDRFSYKALYEERLTHPKIKKQGKWEIVTWKEALETVITEIQKIVSDHGTEQLACLVSPNTTVEEGYLLQKWLRGFGSNNIDYRLRQTDFRQDKYQSQHEFSEGSRADGLLGMHLQELEHQRAIVLVGSDLRNEQPILNLKLRKLALNHGQVFAINPIDFSFTFDLTGKSIVEAGNLVQGVAKIIKAILEYSDERGLKLQAVDSELKSMLSDLNITDADKIFAASLMENEPAEQNNHVLILMGAYALNHPDAWVIEYLSLALARLLGGKLGKLTEGANALGLRAAACLPNRVFSESNTTLAGQDKHANFIATPGLNASESLNAKLKAYVLFGIDPEFDCADDAVVRSALAEAKTVIAFSAFENAVLTEHASVLLPICPFTETPGTYVNAFGTWQSFKAAVQPFQDAKPAWKILRMLGVLSGFPNFEYQQENEILQEVKKGSSLDIGHRESVQCPDLTPSTDLTPATVVKVSNYSLYSVDALVRRSLPLQQTKVAQDRFARMHPNVGEKFNLKSEDRIVIEYGDNEVVLDLILDARIPHGSLSLPGATEETLGLGSPYVKLTVKAFK